MSAFPLPVIAVSGTPAECGAAYGAAAADLIAENNETYLRRFESYAGLDQATVRTSGAAFRVTTHEYHPRLGAMLDAVAEGSGVPAAEIYALNGRTELLYGGGRGARPDGECTAIGLIGDGTLLGQNWDWHPDQRPYSLLLATTDERDHTVVAMTEAGMLAKAGLNSAGVGVCVNMLGSDRDGAAGGVPYHVILRSVLEASDLTDALRSVCRSPRSASINLLIGQAHDGPGGGEVIDVEAVPGDVGFLHPDEHGRLVHANHLETGVAAHDTLKDFGGSSFFRTARAKRLLAAGMTMADVFADHLGYPNAICRHIDERDDPADHSETVVSILLDLDVRRLGVATGPPCGSSYEWLTLAQAAKPPSVL
jgi:isopenicillin-N N-acyltransferase-like protein